MLVVEDMQLERIRGKPVLIMEANRPTGRTVVDSCSRTEKAKLPSVLGWLALGSRSQLVELQLLRNLVGIRKLLVEQAWRGSCMRPLLMV